MNSAPSPRTNSSSVGRASPVTRQPRSRRERHDVPADRTGRAGHQQRPALAVAEDVDQLGRGQGVERHGGRLDQVEPVRHDGHVGGRAARAARRRCRSRGRSRRPGRPPGCRAPGRRRPPASRTVPAKSQPRPVCSGWWIRPSSCRTPARTTRSTGFTVAAATATRTWPGSRATTGTSTYSIASGSPGSVTTAARKVVLAAWSWEFLHRDCGCCHSPEQSARRGASHGEQAPESA